MGVVSLSIVTGGHSHFLLFLCFFSSVPKVAQPKLSVRQPKIRRTWQLRKKNWSRNLKNLFGLWRRRHEVNSMNGENPKSKERGESETGRGPEKPVINGPVLRSLPQKPEAGKDQSVIGSIGKKCTWVSRCLSSCPDNFRAFGTEGFRKLFVTYEWWTSHDFLQLLEWPS